MAARVARKANRASGTREDIANVGNERYGFVLRPAEHEFSVLHCDVVHGVDLFADICAGIFCLLCRTRRKRGHGIEYGRLSIAKALYDSPACIFHRLETDIDLVAEGKVRKMK